MARFEAEACYDGNDGAIFDGGSGFDGGGGALYDSGFDGGGGALYDFGFDGGAGALYNSDGGSRFDGGAGALYNSDGGARFDEGAGVLYDNDGGVKFDGGAGARYDGDDGIKFGNGSEFDGNNGSECWGEQNSTSEEMKETEDSEKPKRRPGSRGPLPGRGGRPIGKAGETRAESKTKRTKHQKKQKTKSSRSSLEGASSIGSSSAGIKSSSSKISSSGSFIPPTTMALSSHGSTSTITSPNGSNFLPNFNFHLPPPGYDSTGRRIESGGTVSRRIDRGGSVSRGSRGGSGLGRGSLSRGSHMVSGWASFIQDRIHTGRPHEAPSSTVDVQNYSANRGAKLVAISAKCNKFFENRKADIDAFLGLVPPFDQTVEMGDLSGRVFVIRIVTEDVALDEIRKLNCLQFEFSPIEASVHVNVTPTKFPDIVHI